jgi:hypothetical protein
MPARRLPAVRSLAAQLQTRRIHGTRVGDAAAFLVAHRDELESFEDVEHLALSTDLEYAPPEITPELMKSARGLAHHLGVVRSSLAEALWSREIFVDAQILDEVVFWTAKNPQHQDVVMGALETIRDARVNRPGLLIFPLHSLGFAGFGVVPPAHRRLAIVNPDGGYALAPQTNSMDRTIKFLDEVAKAFGAQKTVSRDLLLHWRRTRGTSWLEHNPLLVLRTIQIPGSYYGNQAFLLARVRATTALVCILSTLQRAVSHEGELYSTRAFNNWQTLDIHHYITLFDATARSTELQGYCVPIQDGRNEVAELSALDLDLDPRHAPRTSKNAVRAHTAVEQLFTSYLHDRVLRRRETARTRTVTKFFNALSFYRRSFQRGPGDWRAKVALATAFEMLLTDSYGGITTILKRRASLLLTGVPGVVKMVSAVESTYVARSSVVHSGTDSDADLARARLAFALCFVALVERLPNLSATTATPIADLTDHYPRPAS